MIEHFPGVACQGRQQFSWGSTPAGCPRGPEHLSAPGRSRSACGTARWAVPSGATPGGEPRGGGVRRSAVGAVILGDGHDCTHRSLPVPAPVARRARCHHRRAGDAGLRPQRGRLRGARRPARGGGLPPRRGPGRRGDRRGQHLRLRRGRQEGLRRHPPRGLRPQVRGVHQGGRRGGLPGRALRQGPRRVAARGRRRPRLRRLPRHRGPAALDPRGRAAPSAHATGPPPAAADLAGGARREHRRGARAHGRGARPADRSGPGVRPPRRPPPPRRRADGSAQAGQRLRPAVLVLRDPVVPGLVRLEAPQRRARRGPVAGRAGRQGAVPGQRELHVLRQGPRRPSAPGDAAARAGGRRGRRAGAGVLPPARRDPARPGHRDRGDAGRGGRTSTSPSSTPPTPSCAGCAASATPRASSG